MPLTSRDVWTKPTSEINRRSVLRGPGGLLDQLEDPRPQVRRWAVRDLSQFSEAVKPLLTCLQRENDPGVRESIFTALLLIGNEKVARGVVALLKSDDAGLRNGAFDMLMEMPPFAGLVIPDLLADPDPLLRVYGVELVRRLQPPNTVEWLSAMINREDNENVLASLIDCVAALSLNTLANKVGSITSKSGFVNFAMQHALARLSMEKG
ncbi:MAG: HEAT repeat domain-containing protein [Magnetococcales bacterium]|nr:HEAT repeat domain-containing protein [Magnetococcales bacterium]